MAFRCNRPRNGLPPVPLLADGYHRHNGADEAPLPPVLLNGVYRLTAKDALPPLMPDAAEPMHVYVANDPYHAVGCSCGNTAAFTEYCSVAVLREGWVPSGQCLAFDYTYARYGVALTDNGTQLVTSRAMTAHVCLHVDVAQWSGQPELRCLLNGAEITPPIPLYGQGLHTLDFITPLPRRAQLRFMVNHGDIALQGNGTALAQLTVVKV